MYREDWKWKEEKDSFKKKPHHLLLPYMVYKYWNYKDERVHEDESP